MPSSNNKHSISECMKITMNNRRKWITETNISVDEIFAEFPKLSDYCGDMVSDRFCVCALYLSTILLLIH